MNTEREKERVITMRKLRSLGYFIALMGITGLACYYLDIGRTREHPMIVVIGIAFCIFASWRMFYLASVVKHWRD